MPAAPNKQTQLAHLQAVLKKKTPAPADPPERPVLEEVVYAILRDGATPEQADAAFARLKERETFVDWNDIRVSSVQEVADAIHGLPGAGDKSERVIKFLQEVFDEIYNFDLGDIAKKGVKQAAKQLARYKSGVNEFVVAWVTQRALGGHAIPLDQPTVRVLQRLGVLDADADDIEAARGTLEHHIPKTAGPDFTDRAAVFAATICTEDHPKCEGCPMLSHCPTGQTLTAKPKKDKEGKETKPKRK
jgi:endonuclease III